MRFPFALLCAGFALAGPALADPYVFTVGADGDQCSTTSIQEAVDLARAHEGFDIIHIARNLSYTGQDIVIRSGTVREELQIVGGYASCRASNEFETPVGRTTISGAGGALAPVFAVADGSDVDIELRQLAIVRGDAHNTTRSGRGGGISFSGRGYLTLVDTAVLQNSADDGGGIHFASRGDAAVLEFKSDVVISGNVALRDGGGVVVDGTRGPRATFYAVAPRVSIKDNRAPDGRGGGLFAHGFVNINLGSPGFGTPNTALFADNQARDGGGMAVKADSDDASDGPEVIAQSETTDQSVQFHGNVASALGGAVFVQGDYDGPDISSATVTLRDFLFTENVAADGAVSYVSGGGHGNHLQLLTGRCRVYPCHRAERNRTTGGGGSLIRVRADGHLRSDRGTFAYNEATHLLRIDGHHHDDFAPGATLAQWAVVLNTFTGSIYHMDSEYGRLAVLESTIADNESTAVFHTADARDHLSVRHSIVSETEALYLDNSPETPLVSAFNVVSQASMIGPADAGSVVAPANFLDRTAGDYRLKPGARAVDFTLAGGAIYDLLFSGRDRDFALKQNVAGPRDAGAIEYEALSDELVMNNDFAGDLRAWDAVPVGNAASVIARDASGVDSVGSLLATLPMDTPAGDHVVARQCIPMPAGGDYRLTGLANSGPTGADHPDVAVVRVLLRTGASDCDPSVPVVGTGEAAFRTGGWWSLAPHAVRVGHAVAPQFTTSIELQLVVRRAAARVGSNASLVRFDRLSLVPGSVAATPLLRDSFEDR